MPLNKLSILTNPRRYLWINLGIDIDRFVTFTIVNLFSIISLYKYKFYDLYYQNRTPDWCFDWSLKKN